MVFVNRDGRISEHKPWLVSIVNLTSGIGGAIMQFFSTLLAPFMQARQSFQSNSRENRGWSNGGRGGSGGGSGRPGSGPGPNRRIGRIVNSMDSNIPGGGCPGGGCSR